MKFIYFILIVILLRTSNTQLFCAEQDVESVKKEIHSILEFLDKDEIAKQELQGLLDKSNTSEFRQELNNLAVNDPILEIASNIAMLESQGLQRLPIKANKENQERLDALFENNSVKEKIQFVGTISINGQILPNNIQNFVNLRLIEQRSVQNDKGITQIPESIGKLQNLKKILIFSKDTLEKLPNSLFSIKGLETIDISCSGMKGDFDFDLSGLQKLQELKLVKCDITNIPDSIGKLTQLKKLNLRNNAIKDLPATINNLKNLETLVLINNQLEQLSVEGLTNLKELVLLNNPIKKLKLPKNFKQIQNINLMDTKLEEIDMKKLFIDLIDKRQNKLELKMTLPNGTELDSSQAMVVEGIRNEIKQYNEKNKQEDVGKEFEKCMGIAK